MRGERVTQFAPLPWDLRLAMVEEVVALLLADVANLRQSFEIAASAESRRHETVRRDQEDRSVRSDLTCSPRTARELHD